MSQPPTMCEVCGIDVAPEIAIKAEMTVSAAMCPSAMVFHPGCYEQALAMWTPDPDSYCLVDTRFPETMLWTVDATDAGATDAGATDAGAVGAEASSL